jgi:hypothetical protein
MFHYTPVIQRQPAVLKSLAAVTLALQSLGTLHHQVQLQIRQLFPSIFRHQQPLLILAFGQLQLLALITSAALLAHRLQQELLLALSASALAHFQFPLPNF